MQMRPYQREALNAVAADAMAGCKRQLVVLPTGGGKTIIFAMLPDTLKLRRPDKMLVLVQADELCFQAVKKLSACNPGLRIGLEKAQYKSSWSDDIVVASVQTLGGSKKNEDGAWEWSKRLNALDRDAFRYIVIDEVHHSCSSQYAGPLRYFGVCKSDPPFNDPAKFLLGVTATPNRSDNKGLEAFFDKIVYSRDIRSMMADGWLTQLEAHRIDTMVDISNVDVRQGDYVRSQLERAINTPERNKLVVDKYLELGEGAPFLGFTCDIQHTIDLTQCFRDRGIECFGIASRSGAGSEWLITGEKERAKVISDFDAGRIRGLLSCQALLEGFDAPRAMVGLGAAPTRSTLRFTQSIGRVLRPFPAPEASATWEGWRKRCAIWLDFCDNASKHSAGLVTAPTLIGLRPDFDAKGKSLTKIAEEIERIKASKPSLNTSLYTNLDSLRAISQRIDMFATPVIAPEIAKHSKLAWVSGVSVGVYQLALPGDKPIMLTIRENALGEHEVSRHVNGVKTPLGTAASIKDALAMAEKQVPSDASQVLNTNAVWRKLPPTDKQFEIMDQLYMDWKSKFNSREAFRAMLRDRYSRGEISQLISQRDRRAGR